MDTTHVHTSHKGCPTTSWHKSCQRWNYWWWAPNTSVEDMRQAMDALLSAVASDVIGRLISLLIDKYRERGVAGKHSGDTTDTAVRLQRALLRARVVVEEADGRQIANRAMLQQLSQLRRLLCQAAYALDAFRWRADRRWHVKVSRSQPQTRPLQPSSYDAGVLLVMVENLEAALRDMREFVVLLGGCPRVTRQPYSVYLFMESCMFGRQMEKEEIIGFLLKPSQDLDVLPIIGPHEVGKRTLVEHVCLDERVRERFTKIHRLRSNDLLDDVQSPDNDDWTGSMFDFTARSLMVFDIVDDTADAEESWRRFHTSVRRRAQHRGSKIIVISRTEAHAGLGTAPPLRLHAPRREELWYFFRALAFGAADPDERPDLARIAMALCAEISDVALFAAAGFAAASLRGFQSARSWRRVRKMYAEATAPRLDEGKAGPCCLYRPATEHAPGVPFLFYNRRKLTSVARNELPEVTMLELLTGSSVPPAGEARFDMLLWQSRIPPYASYVATCDMDTARQVVAGEKQVRKRWRDL